MSAPSVDESVCPLCGKGNLCGLQQGRSAESCWCRDVSFSREALAGIPEGLRGKVCICADCAVSRFPPAGDSAA